MTPAYDSNFRFSLDRKLPYDSTFDSVAIENQRQVSIKVVEIPLIIYCTMKSSMPYISVVFDCCFFDFSIQFVGVLN